MGRGRGHDLNMANPLKGEAAFTLGEGKAAKAYTLAYNIDALVQLEDVLNDDIASIGRKFATGMRRLGFVRAVLWAGLRTHHPELDLKAAGELLAEPEAADIISAKLLEAFGSAFPKAEDADPAARPPEGGRAAEPGTGSSSTANGDASA